MCPSRQRVTLRFVVRALEIIDSTGLEVVRVLASRPSIPRRVTVNICSRPSRSDAAAPGWVFVQAAGQVTGVAQPEVGIGVGAGPHELGVDERFALIWQVIRDVPAVVQGAALDESLLTEHALHGGGQRLRAVQDDE